MASLQPALTHPFQGFWWVWWGDCCARCPEILQYFPIILPKRSRETSQDWLNLTSSEPLREIILHKNKYKHLSAFSALLSSHGNFAPGYLNIDRKCLTQPLQTQLDNRPQQDFESLPIQKWTLLIWSYKIIWINRYKSSLRILPSVKITLRKVKSLESGLIRLKRAHRCIVPDALLIHDKNSVTRAVRSNCPARCFRKLGTSS